MSEHTFAPRDAHGGVLMMRPASQNKMHKKSRIPSISMGEYETIRKVSCAPRCQMHSCRSNWKICSDNLTLVGMRLSTSFLLAPHKSIYSPGCQHRLKVGIKTKKMLSCGVGTSMNAFGIYTQIAGPRRVNPCSSKLASLNRSGHTLGHHQSCISARPRTPCLSL